jgi:hypothetical protein
MTLGPSTCPRCGVAKSVNAIYIRNEAGTDLECFSCMQVRREGDAIRPLDRLPTSSRRLLRRIP